MKQLIIIGVGGLAREVWLYAKDSVGNGAEWIVKGFIDGDVKVQNEEYNKLEGPLLGNIDDYCISENDVFVCAIGSSKVRRRIVEFMKKKGAIFINLISNKAIVSDKAALGSGIIIAPFCFVSSDVVINDGVLLNIYTSVGHDSVLGKFSSTMVKVNITGNCVVGENTYWGSGSQALPHSKIENNAVIGAASLVLKHVKDSDVVVGIPARSIKK